MVLTETPSARAASPADRNSLFFIFLFYAIVSIFVNIFLRSRTERRSWRRRAGSATTFDLDDLAAYDREIEDEEQPTMPSHDESYGSVHESRSRSLGTS